MELLAWLEKYIALTAVAALPENWKQDLVDRTWLAENATGDERVVCPT